MAAHLTAAVPKANLTLLPHYASVRLAERLFFHQYFDNDSYCNDTHITLGIDELINIGCVLDVSKNTIVKTNLEGHHCTIGGTTQSRDTSCTLSCKPKLHRPHMSPHRC